MEALLIMFRDGGDNRPFRLTKDGTVIGRREDCDLRIAVGDVSRKHCRVMMNGGQLRVEDLGSSNGTFVNGTRVQNAELSAGDTLQVGPVAFVVQIDGEPSIADAKLNTRSAGGSRSGSSSGVGVAVQKKGRSGDAVTIGGDDGEIDELSILNESGDSGAAGGDVLDIDK